MGKSKAGRKKVSLTARAKQMKKSISETKRNQARKALTAEKMRLRQERLKRESAKVLYSPNEKILLVGEGDFSFTKALVQVWDKQRQAREEADVAEDLFPGYLNLVASCLDSKMELVTKYPHIMEVLATLVDANVQVLTSVDGVEIGTNQDVLEDVDLTHEDGSAGFDKIVFNFPHTGCGIKDTFENNYVHQQLIAGFLSSTKRLLRDESSEIHVTVKKGEPYSSWGLSKLPSEIPGIKLKCIREFYPHLFPGYVHRRTLGSASKGEAEGGPAENADITKSGAHTFVYSLLTEKPQEEDE